MRIFFKDEQGNIAVTFAVCLFVLLLGVGVAVDFSGLSSKNSKYQNMADAAVLAASKSGEEDKEALRKIVTDVINLNNISDDTVAVNVKLDKPGHVSVELHGSYKPVIMSLFGKSTLNVNATAQAPLSSYVAINVALVLDTTWSMNGAKMTSLKAAAIDMVTSLEATGSETLRVSVIPFSQYINVGLSHRNANWLSDTTDYTETFDEVCSLESPVIGTTNCRQVDVPARAAIPSKPATTCYNDGVPYSCGGEEAQSARPAGTQEVCDDVLGLAQNVCKTPGPSNNVWRGCVGSRDAPWDQRAEFTSRLIPGLFNISCGTEIQTLTKDFSAIKSTIASLDANGETYLPSGLLWGWRALMPSQPLNEAATGQSASKRRNIMVLMTDGANTKSKIGIRHTGNDGDAANDLSRALCREIKASDVEVFTIAYEFGDVEAKNILRNCATNNSMFFDARNAADLQRAFESIGEILLTVRLTQ